LKNKFGPVEENTLTEAVSLAEAASPEEKVPKE
jgi:hypothetical protein